MKKFLILLICFSFACNEAHSQGCIPIRNLIVFGQFANPEADPLTEVPTKWVVNVNQRFLESSKTFDGSNEKEEEPYQVKTTRLYVMDIGLMRFFERGWSLGINLPISSGSRTAWRPEHGNFDSARHITRAIGIGDIRLTVYKWLWDVSVHPRWNVQAGLGLKLPTGDYRFQDYFYKNDTTRVLAPVNQAIQNGDGGTGITTEINAYYTVSKLINLYASFFYLVNPRDHNGVYSLFAGPPRVPGHPTIPGYMAEQATSTVNSVPDSYTVRLGANFTMKNFVFWSGVRAEGAPVHDLIGESNGQRRAGKIISVEPGVNYRLKNTVIYAFVPIPVYRTTYQTVPDKRISDLSGTYVSSPGGFADYLVFAGVAIKL